MTQNSLNKASSATLPNVASNSQKLAESQLKNHAGYRQYQLQRIRPQVKTLGNLAALILLLMLPWDYQSESVDRYAAMAMRMVAVLQLYLIAVFWQKSWLEKHFVSVLMAFGLVSFLGLCANYLLLPERIPYLYTILYYYNLAFLVLVPLASTLQILLVFFVPTLLMYGMLHTAGGLDAYLVPFALHTIPLLLILNMAAWYVRMVAMDQYALYCENIELASQDALTGLLNRRVWETQTRKLLARTKRESSSIAVCMIDLDFFKRINDTWGHAAGDEALKAVALTLTDTLREYDVLGRFGGEEFTISIGGLSLEQVKLVGERLRKAIEQLKIKLGNTTGVTLTASVGIAWCANSTLSLEALMLASDNAMYEAKHKGRNQMDLVCF